MNSSARLKLSALFSVLLLFIVSFALFDSSIFTVHAASASISLSPMYGPPTSAVNVKGSGFKGRETVLVAFDSTQIKSVTAGSTGSFSTNVTIPGSALPGNHFVHASGKSSGLFAQTIFLVQTDWVQQGFNREHTGFNVFENVLNTGNVSQLTQSWSFNSDYGGGMIAVAHGIVYFGCDQLYICAISATTGQWLWLYNINEQVIDTPAVANNQVYISTPGGWVDAINATSGKLVWRYATGFAINNTPLTANGLVYVGVSNGALYVFNGTTGQVVWKRTFPSIFSTPSIDGSLLYVSAGGNLYALKSQTGQIVWQVSVKGGTPVIANGMIYLSDTANNSLLALSEQAGVVRWSERYPNIPPSPSDPSVANGVIYVIGDCMLDALSATTGAVLWQFDGSASGDCLTGTTTIANGVIYAMGTVDQNNGFVDMFSTYGVLVRRLGTSNTIGITSPVVVNGTLYYSDEYGTYAYSLTSSV